jgi:1-phosphofructokinase
VVEVVIFAPSPLLTVTIEDVSGGPDLHVHAGGQGVWQSRMLRTLGRSVGICAVLTGEAGGVVRDLLQDEGITVNAVDREGRAPAYVHDQRSGHRDVFVDLPGDPLSRHDLDELYTIMLRESMHAEVVILSGPADEGIVPDDLYRRLAADVMTTGTRVVVDLAGARLDAALHGGVSVVKVSDSELADAGRIVGDSVDQLVEAGRRLQRDGAQSVIVTRAGKDTLVIDGDQVFAVRVPIMEEVDPRGAGDSFTAAFVSALLDGEAMRDAVTQGAAAGALNVTRHGLGTGDPQAIRRLRDQVEVRPLDATAQAGEAGEVVETVSPRDLATHTETEQP